MNFDIDIFREFTFYLSSNLTLNEYGCCEPIDPNKPLPNREQLAEISDGEIAFLIREYSNNGLIETKIFAHQAIPMVTGLTLEGYKIAQSLSNENVWTELRKVTNKIRTLTDLLAFLKK